MSSAVLRRTLMAIAVASALTVGTAAATSLGAFTRPVATGYAADLVPCTYTSGTVLDGPIDLLATLPLPTSSITTVELSGVAGDCDGYVPIVVVEGFDLLGGPSEVVLFVIDALPPLGPRDTGTVTLSSFGPIALGDGLVTLFSVPTNVRVGFCPGASTCT